MEVAADQGGEEVQQQGCRELIDILVEFGPESPLNLADDGSGLILGNSIFFSQLEGQDAALSAVR